MWGKDDGDYDSPQVGMRLRTKKIKKRRPKKKREGIMLLSFSTVLLQSSTMFFMTESLLFCHFHILVGIFHYKNLACIFQWRASSNCPRSSWASELDAHQLSFFLSFHTLIALMHPLHGNSYSLASISIDGHLHSPLICLVDVRLYPFCILLTTSTILYSTYIAISVAHAHVLRDSWKSLRTWKVWNNCLAYHRGCAWWNILCDEDRAWPDYMIL